MTPGRRSCPQNDPTNNHDIREYVTPPRPLRNRRIIESDSSEERDLGGAAAQPVPLPLHAPPRQTQPPAAQRDQIQQPQTIEIASDSESSDSMYVPASSRARVENTLQDRNGRQPTPNRQREPTQQRQQRTPQRRRRQGRTPAHQRLLDEAESTSEEESSGMTADESDQNAAELYRSAMLGVRNRPCAAQQVGNKFNTTRLMH